MIRYRTRDLTRLLPPTARSMRRIEKITRPLDDMLIIRGVNLFPTSRGADPQQAELTPYYMLEVTRPDVLDELTCTRDGQHLAYGAQEARHAAARKLEQAASRPTSG